MTAWAMKSGKFGIANTIRNGCVERALCDLVKGSEADGRGRRRNHLTFEDSAWNFRSGGKKGDLRFIVKVEAKERR